MDESSHDPFAEGWEHLDLPPTPGRQLFVAEALPDDVVATLQDRGYNVVDLRAEPVDESPEGLRTYLGAWLQGMVEGTIKLSGERRRMIEAQAKLYGLIVSKSMEVSLPMDQQTLEALLELSNGRRTFKPVSMEKLDQALERSLEPPKAASVPAPDGEIDG